MDDRVFITLIFVIKDLDEFNCGCWRIDMYN